jgi:glycosyltransferase involved in cell wall biosynthesis
MPLFNEERFLAASLEALLAQEFADFEIVASDNCSTDRTWEILQAYAARDARLRCLRQAENLGAARNSRAAYDVTRGRLLMYASGHDLWDPRHLAACVEAMRDPGVALAYPKARGIDGDGASLGPIPADIDTRGMDRLSRLNVVLWGLAYSYQVYGLFRREALRDIPAQPMLAPDNLFLAGCALDGAFAQIPETLFHVRRLADFGSWESYVRKIFGRTLAETGASPAELYFRMVRAFQHLIATRVPAGFERDAMLASVTQCLTIKYLGILDGIEGQAGVASGAVAETLERMGGAARDAVAHADLRAHPPRIVVDGVFFQRYGTGVARLWRSLLEQWAGTDFGRRIVLLDRAGTAPAIPGIRTVAAPAHDYSRLEADRHAVQALCDREQADLFVSTYCSTPLSTPALFLAYDMIPEVMGFDPQAPMWQEKRQAIAYASGYVAISHNTARDLARFYPSAAARGIIVAHCGVSAAFRPADEAEVEAFRARHGITRPYFMVAGARGSYKNTALFFRALATLPGRGELEVVCTGGAPALEPEYAALLGPTRAHVLDLADDELRLAYAGARALAYPSFYEGFGLPVAEAMACGCPVIVSPCASLPEVAGSAALYVEPDDVPAMASALQRIAELELRAALVAAGPKRAALFSWNAMADRLRETLDALAVGLRTGQRPRA